MGVSTLERQPSIIEHLDEAIETQSEVKESSNDSDSEKFIDGVAEGKYDSKEISQWILGISASEDLNDGQKIKLFHRLYLKVLDAIQDLRDKEKNFILQNQGGGARKKDLIEQVSKGFMGKVSELQGILQEIRYQQQNLESGSAQPVESVLDVEHMSQQTLEMMVENLDKVLQVDPGNIEALLKKQKIEEVVERNKDAEIVERLGMSKGKALPQDLSVDSIVSMMQIDVEFSGSAVKKSRIRTGDNQAILSENPQDIEAQRKGAEVETFAAVEISEIDGVIAVVELPQDSIADHREVTDLLVLTLKEEFQDVLDDEDIGQMVVGLAWKIRREANRMSQKLGIDVRADVHSSYASSAEKDLYLEKLQDLEEALEVRKIQIKSSIEGLKNGYKEYQNYHSRNPGQIQDVGFLSYRDEAQNHSTKWFQKSAMKVLGIN
jgi:hypothetical protein